MFRKCTFTDKCFDNNASFLVSVLFEQFVVPVACVSIDNFYRNKWVRQQFIHIWSNTGSKPLKEFAVIALGTRLTVWPSPIFYKMSSFLVFGFSLCYPHLLRFIRFVLFCTTSFHLSFIFWIKWYILGCIVFIWIFSKYSWSEYNFATFWIAE